MHNFADAVPMSAVVNARLSSDMSPNLAVGSGGTAKRNWRGAPATSSISVVVPATTGDPQPDEPLRALCVPWEVTELVALAGVAREAVATRAAPNTNIRAPRVLSRHTPNTVAHRDRRSDCCLGTCTATVDTCTDCPIRSSSADVFSRPNSESVELSARRRRQMWPRCRWRDGRE